MRRPLEPYEKKRMQLLVWCRLKAFVTVLLVMAALCGVVALNDYLQQRTYERMLEEQHEKLTIGGMQTSTEDSPVGQAIEPNGFVADHETWSPMQRWLFERRYQELVESGLIPMYSADLRGAYWPNAVRHDRGGQAPLYKEIPIA